MPIDVDAIIARLPECYGRLIPVDLSLDPQKNAPSILSPGLCEALLMNARISHGTAIAAARALSNVGWMAVAKMAGSQWENRVEVFRRARHAQLVTALVRVEPDRTSKDQRFAQRHEAGA